MEADGSTEPKLEELMLQDAGLGLPEMTDREWACAVLPELDYEAQLIAIAGFLRRNVEAERRTTEEIESLDRLARRSSGIQNERLVDLWCDEIHASTYQDAAHSMAAVGMLAPFYESLFVHAFQGIGRRYFGQNIPQSERTPIAPLKHFWDCHYHYDSTEKKTKKGVVKGIAQLAGAVGLSPLLPSGLSETLKALFEYRNAMFHNGFEWPEDGRKNFEKKIKDNQWEFRFVWAKHGEEPWICYMSDGFVNQCLELVNKVLEALGAYCRTTEPIQQELIPVEPPKVS